MPKSATEIQLQIKVVNPPKGVLFALQRGKNELVTPMLAAGDTLSFTFSVRIADKDAGPPNFLGPFVQGPRGERFVYINSGTSAGQMASCWTRRAKIPLKGIGWDMVDRVLASPGSMLVASIAGTGKDGGPACATVPLLGGNWEFVASI